MASRKNNNQGATEKQTVKVLRVRSLPERFRRAGITFGRTEKDLPVDSLTEEQIKALKEEPRLHVTEAEIEAEAKEEKEAEQ